MVHPQKKFMRAAIAEAVKARKAGDYAIGAVLVKGSQIVARSGNRVKIEQDPTQHAEVAVLRKAARRLRTRHLLGCVLYTTHEPCPMCAGAAIFARLDSVVIGARVKDMQSYRKVRSVNHEWSWRTLPLPARKVFALSELPIRVVEDFMREECKSLFHD